MRNWGSRNKNSARLKGSMRPALYILKRLPILFMISAFLFTAIIPNDLAWAKKTETMPSPIGKGESVGPGHLSLLGPSDITISPFFGTIKERFQPDGEPKGFIVYIQDLHTHFEAHTNIAYIIEQLARKHGINLIMCEAKETDRGFAYLRPWTKADARKKVAHNNLKKGVITGWEYLDLTTDLDLILQGIEDKELYMKDMDSFLKAEAIRPEGLKFVDLLKSIAGNLKRHMYTQQQRAFDDKMEWYRDEKIGIAEYSQYLIEMAGKYSVDHNKFKNLNILQETIKLERKIDFDRADIEREALIDELDKRLLDDEMKLLLGMSMKFKANRISQNEFYQFLKALCHKHDINMMQHANFGLYTEYIEIYHGLDASRLFAEMNNLENLLSEKLFTQQSQKTLFKISKNLIILRGLVDFKLTPDEFDYYADTKSGFDMRNWLEFLRLNSEYFNLTQRIPDDAAIIEDNLETLENFYKVAHERDEAFVNNIGKQLSDRGVKNAILTTGGFHTPGVTRRLKEKGYSYVVISPRIEEEMDYKRYYNILKEAYGWLKEAAAAIGAWSRTELQGFQQRLITQIRGPSGTRSAESDRENMHVVTPEQDRYLFATRGALAIITAQGAAYLSPRAMGLADAGLLKLPEFLQAIQRALDQNRPPSEAAQMASDARETERQAQEPTPANYDDRAGKHEDVGDETTTVCRAEGPVEVTLLGETEGELIGPGEALITSYGQMEVGVPLAKTREGIRFMGERVITEDVRSSLQAEADLIYKQRPAIMASVKAAGVDFVNEIDVDAIAQELEHIEDNEEALREYVASFIVGPMYDWRIVEGSRVYFDIVGTKENEAKVAKLKEIYYSLPQVQANLPFMWLYSDDDSIDDDRRSAARRATISHESSNLAANNPVLFAGSRILDAEGQQLNFYAWNLAFLAGTRIMLQDETDNESIRNGIAVGRGENAFELQHVLARLARIDQRAISAELIAKLYQYVEGLPLSQQEEAYVSILRLLSMKPIQAFNFNTMRQIHEMLEQVRLSV